MGYTTTAYVAYGARLPDDTDWHEVGESLGYAGPVHLFSAGQYDADFYFLTAISRSVELGSYWEVGPYLASEEKYAAWDWSIVDTAQKLGLKLLSEPAWLFIPDLS